MANVTKVEAQQTDSLNQSEAFFLKYKKAILAALGALVVVVLGWFLINEYVFKPQAVEAQTALAKGQQYMLEGQYDKALKGDGAKFKGFLGVLSDYGSTEAGNLANLYAGLCYAHQEKPDWKKALEYVEKFDTSNDMLISPASQMALGDIYANNDQLDKAVEAFKRAAELANKQAQDGVNSSVAPLALRKAGIILESQGKKDDANAIYRDIKAKYLNSATIQDIDKYIERTAK